MSKHAVGKEWGQTLRDPKSTAILEEAIQAERNDSLEEAANLYENLLQEDKPSLDALLNLAVLYWQVTDYGYWTNKSLSQDFVARAGQRLEQVLIRAQNLYPNSTVARFWAKYIEWADIGEPLSTEECESLLQEDPSSPIPALYLFSQNNGEGYQAEISELLRQSKEADTTLGRYVESVIEGIYARKG